MAVESAFTQTLPSSSYEVLVIKNFSDQDLDLRLSSMGAKLLLSSALSPGEKVAEALQSARGDVICFLDDDDEFEPTKLQRVYELFNAGADYYHNGQKVVTDQGRVVRQDRGNHEFRIFGKDKLTYFRSVSGLNSSCISIRKKILESERDNLLRAKYSVDWFYLAAGLLHGDLLVQDREPLTVYRKHANQSDLDLSGPSGFIGRRKVTYRRELDAALVMYQMLANTPYDEVARRILARAKIHYARYASSDDAKLSLSDALYAARSDLKTLVATDSLTITLILRSMYSSIIPFLPMGVRRVEALREYKRYVQALYPHIYCSPLSLPSRALLAATTILGIALVAVILRSPSMAMHVLFHLDRFRRFSLRHLYARA
ncbi:MAG: glycosyltransferase family 2 protein [Thermoprotei archaeon]